MRGIRTFPLDISPQDISQGTFPPEHPPPPPPPPQPGDLGPSFFVCDLQMKINKFRFIIIQGNFIRCKPHNKRF